MLTQMLPHCRTWGDVCDAYLEAPRRRSSGEGRRQRKWPTVGTGAPESEEHDPMVDENVLQSLREAMRRHHPHLYGGDADGGRSTAQESAE